MNLYYNDDFTASEYAFDTTRKSAEIARSLAVDPIAGVSVADPAGLYSITEALLASVHEPDYVEAVRTGRPAVVAESQGFTWDEGVYTMALAHNAGVVAAMADALDGAPVTGCLSSGLHHADWDLGNGFCTFNGLAVAADYAAGRGARVLVVDFDAHCGGGTSRLLPEGAAQVDVSVNPYDAYRPQADQYLVLADAGLYEQEIKDALGHVSTLGSFDVVIYNAGMDPANCGVKPDQLAIRERMVADYDFGCPLIYTMAGGYTWGDKTMDEVVDLHRLTIATFAA